jgi:hypothetical protein
MTFFGCPRIVKFTAVNQKIDFYKRGHQKTFYALPLIRKKIDNVLLVVTMLNGFYSNYHFAITLKVHSNYERVRHT